MRIPLFLAAAALVLSGCVNRLPLSADSPYAGERLAGASFVLDQSLTVPAGRARVFLQDGGVVGGFDQYRPHCALEIRSVQHDGFEVAPGVFRITRVQHSLEQVVDAGGRQFARTLPGVWLGRMIDGGGSASFHEGYHFWLDAPGRPEVMRLSCYGTYDRPPDLQPPTLAEIRAVLGSLGRIVES
jgi:hypothetical protein